VAFLCLRWGEDWCSAPVPEADLFSLAALPRGRDLGVVRSPVSFLRLFLFFLVMVVLTWGIWLASLAVPGLREAEALRALDEEFYLSDSVYVVRSVTESPGSILSDRNFHPRSAVGSVCAAPLRLMNPDGLQRRKALSLYASSTTNVLASLEHLSAFPKLELLELDCAQGWQRSFSRPNLSHLRSLPNLRSLRIDGDIDGDLGMLEGLPIEILWVKGKIDGPLRLPPDLPLRTLLIEGNLQGDLDFLEPYDLEHLSIRGGNESTAAAYARIAANTSLESLFLEGSVVDSARLGALSGLSRLRLLSLSPCPSDLSMFTSLPALERVYLQKQLAVPAIKSLSGSRVEQLVLGGPEFDDKDLPEALATFSNLHCVAYNYFQISQAALAGLRHRGLCLDSYSGVKDYKLTNDYLLWEENYWRVKKAASTLEVEVDADTARLALQFEVQTADPYQPHTCDHPKAESPVFLLEPGQQPGLAGRTTTNVVDLEASAIYYCVWNDPPEVNRLTLLSMEDDHLHLQWRISNSEFPVLDTRLPFDGVRVTSSSELSQERAEQALRHQLDPAMFPRREADDDTTWVFQR